MGYRVCKREKTQFTNVAKIIRENGVIHYMSTFSISKNGVVMKNTKNYDCIRKAAIAVDKYMIENGKEPLNILIKRIKQ